MDIMDKTIPPRRMPGTNPGIDVTMPGKRNRKPDGRFEPGDLILNRYKVVSELGQGGMGVVYKCFDEIAGIEVALKALPPELSHNTLEMEDIKENFQLVAKLVHQNIAISKNLEKDTSNGNYYLIMECAEGEDLCHWIKRKRKERTLTLDAVIPVIRQVAEALDYAHSEKVIHRDIKPGNIMINSAGKVKVLDFGLAAQIHTSMTRVSMAYHGTSGTGPYMAPEQWRGRAQGAPADQYALAVMAYEMLAGHLPFESTDATVLREAVLNDTAEDICGVPKYVENAITRAMSKDPLKRFSNCLDFSATLKGVKKQKKGVNRNKQLSLACLVFIIIGVIVFYGLKYYKQEEQKVIRKETERLAKLETERLAKLKAERLAKLEAERIAKLEAERLAKLETERLAKLETERKEKELAQKKKDNTKKALLLFNEKQYDKAFSLSLQADTDNPQIQFNIGRMYDLGYGIKQNFSQAAVWYKKAANGAHAAAMNHLAFLYQQGQGVQKDINKALELYKRAGKNGSATAYFNIGYIYENGISVKKDSEEALKWYKEAAAKGHKAAEEKYSLLQKKLNHKIAEKIINHEIQDNLPSELVYNFNSNPFSIFSVASCSCGKYIANGGKAKGEIYIYDVKNKKLIRSLNYAEDAVSALKWNCKTGSIYVGDGYGNILEIDVAGNKQIRRFPKKHTTFISMIDFDESQKYLVSAGYDGRVILWDMQNGTPLKTLYKSEKQIFSVKISKNGRYVVYGGQDNKVTCMDIEKAQIVCEISDFLNAVSSITFSDDDKNIIIGSWDNSKSVSKWNFLEKKKIFNLASAHRFTSCVDTSSDNIKFLSSGEDGITKIWRVSDGKLLHSYDSLNADGRNACFITQDLIVRGGKDAIMQFVNLKTQKVEFATAGFPANLKDLSFYNNNSRFIAGDNSGKLLAFNLKNFSLEKIFNNSDKTGVTCIALSPDNRYILTAGTDNRINYWSIDSGELLKEIHYNKKVTSAVFIDKDRVVIGDENGLIGCFDLNTGRPVKSWKAGTQTVNTLLYSPIHKMLIAGLWDNGGVYIIDLKKNKTAKIPIKASVWDGEILPDGDRVGLTCLEARPNAFLTFINLKNLKTEQQFRVDGDGWGVSFSPNGKFFATAGWNFEINIREINTGNVVKTLPGHSAIVQKIRYSSDGNYLISAGSDMAVKYWKIQK